VFYDECHNPQRLYDRITMHQYAVCHNAECFYDVCHYAECFMMSVIMLSVFMIVSSC
jgi:hypothetical protein